eukprot:TRINITY_DN26745_c0_g1_i1.p1 TRINITY_DN26745_c0_g1~~TRINITY_DN26745_c0_g1_i1.p1  ORF type:complete len:486 (+),score=66.18 TRINITY_DN26745_c0_g1_i1:56-1513(+)
MTNLRRLWNVLHLATPTLCVVGLPGTPPHIDIIFRAALLCSVMVWYVGRWHLDVATRSFLGWLRLHSLLSGVALMCISAACNSYYSFLLTNVLVVASEILAYYVFLDNAQGSTWFVVWIAICDAFIFIYRTDIRAADIFGLGLEPYRLFSSVDLLPEHAFLSLVLNATFFLGFVASKLLCRRRRVSASDEVDAHGRYVLPQAIGAGDSSAKDDSESMDFAAVLPGLILDRRINVDQELFHSVSSDGTYDSVTSDEVSLDSRSLDLVTVTVKTVAGASVFQKRVLKDRTLFELKNMITAESTWWPQHLSIVHMELLINNFETMLLLDSTTLRELNLVSEVELQMLVKSFVCITNLKSGFALSEAGAEQHGRLVTRGEDRGTWVVSKFGDGTAVTIKTPCGKILVQDRFGRARLLQLGEEEAMPIGATWYLDRHLREDNFELLIRNVRYDSFLVERPLARGAEHRSQRRVDLVAGRLETAEAKWICR